jgi:hypothetical protein
LGDDGVVHYGNMDVNELENHNVTTATAGMKYCHETDNNK